MEVPILLILSTVLAEEIPDYDRPFSPIFTDKQVYSWTDKIQMKILAPSWNANRYLVDEIGNTEEHPIKISTRENSLEPYRFTETDSNSGVFTAEVILTGFQHDADGDGNPDTVPWTGGHGPTDGFLESNRDSMVTISFEFADGVIVSESVPVRWNIGTLEFLDGHRPSGDTAQIRLVDPDMNLNPEALDTVPINMSSDSDVAGVVIDAIETDLSSGMFIGSISFTQNQSSEGSRLYAVPGDAVYAQYDDHTLPDPYSTSDSLGVQTTATLHSNMPQTDRVANAGILLTDSSGNPLSDFQSMRQIQITGLLENRQEHTQPFVYVLQIKDHSNSVVSLSWMEGQLVMMQSLNISQSWIPTNAGTYGVEAFVWSSLSKMTPLAPPHTSTISVE